MDALLQSVQGKCKLHLFVYDTIFKFIKCILMFVSFQVNLNQCYCASIFISLFAISCQQKVYTHYLGLIFFWKSKKRKKRKITSMNFCRNKLRRCFHSKFFWNIPQQKQPPKGVLKKRFSENMQQIYRRTHMLKCNFNKVAMKLYWNRTSVWVFSCKFAAYFQSTFS